MTCLNERRALLISGLKLELSVVCELSYVEALKTGNAGKGEREIRKILFLSDFARALLTFLPPPSIGSFQCSGGKLFDFCLSLLSRVTSEKSRS